MLNPSDQSLGSSGGMASFTPGDEVSGSEKLGIGLEGERRKRRRLRVEGKQ